MKPRIKKLETHTLTELDITYEFEGEIIKRKVTVKDNTFYECQGFILSKELQYLKEIIEEYFIRKNCEI